MTNTTALLVDGCHGQYIYHNLATRYPLFVGQCKEMLSVWLDTHLDFAHELDFKHETVETVFNPDNPHCNDNIDTLYNIGLYVMDNDGLFWRVESNDGEIIAVHPNAVWDEHKDQYVFEEE